MTEKDAVLSLSQRKKKEAQLEGLKVLENTLVNLIKTGLGAINTQHMQQEITHAVAAMGQYYLPGAQWLLRELLMENQAESKTLLTCGGMTTTKKIHVLVHQGSAYLEKQLARHSLSSNDYTIMEEWLGHAWRFTELRALGMGVHDANYIQLAFHHEAHEARGDLVDQGYWVQLGRENVYLTRHYRPIKAKSRVKSQDSCHHVMMPQEACQYPGTLNCRIRWQSASEREITRQDLEIVRSSGQNSLAQLANRAKKHLTSPLAHPYPAFLWRVKTVGKVGGEILLEDDEQYRIKVTCPQFEYGKALDDNINMALGAITPGDVLLLLLFYDHQNGEMRACPLSLVTEKHLVRFAT